MINVYLAVLPSFHESEDIQVRYHLLQDDAPIKKESLFSSYCKPTVAGQVGMHMLLKRLKPYQNEEITIFINDVPLFELLNGGNITMSKDVAKMAPRTKRELSDFKLLHLVNVTNDLPALEKWDAMTTA